MDDFLVRVALPILGGAFCIAFLGVVKRYILKDAAFSPLQFLIIAYGLSAMVLAGIYVSQWGFESPMLLDGFWRAVLCGTAANFIIQYLNAKAASLPAGEVSLTAPLQAMTPGLITFVGVALGEYPGALGCAGIFFMMVSSYILLADKKAKSVADYFMPLARLRLALSWSTLSKGEREKAQVVFLALGSAMMGTIGLLFDGLFVRRGMNLQGVILGATTMVGILAVAYLFWYLIAPDVPQQRKSVASERSWYALSRGSLLLFILFGLFWAGHVLAILPTFDVAFVASVGSLKRMSVLASVFLGYVLFNEQEFKKRMWAGALVVCGVILISADGLPARISTQIELLGW